MKTIILKKENLKIFLCIVFFISFLFLANNYIEMKKQESFKQGYEQALPYVISVREERETISQERGKNELIEVMIKKGHSVKNVSKLTDIPLQRIQEFSENLKSQKDFVKESNKRWIEITQNGLILREVIRLRGLDKPFDQILINWIGTKHPLFFRESIDQKRTFPIINYIEMKKQESFKQGYEKALKIISDDYREERETRSRERGKNELIEVMIKKGHSVKNVSKLTDIPLQRIQEFSERLKSQKDFVKENNKRWREDPQNSLSLRERIMLSRLDKPIDQIPINWIGTKPPSFFRESIDQKRTFPIIFLMFLPLMVIFLNLVKK